MSEESEAIWPGWHDVAKILNLFINWVALALALIPSLRLLRLGAALNKIVPGAGSSSIARGLLILILAIACAVLYFVFCFKAVKDKDLTALMHIMLMVSTVLAFIAYVPSGACMAAQFLIVGILSDVPFWKAFSK